MIRQPSKTQRILLPIVVMLFTILASVIGTSSIALAAPTAVPSTTLIKLSALPARATEATYDYCTFGTKTFAMDFYRPTGWGPVPVVLQVHGGGWLIGDRTTSVTPGLISAFLNKGIAFATIDYQLGSGQDASQDVSCAVRFLHNWSAYLGLDGRVGAMGQSAGGQLVSLLGTTTKADGFDVGQYPNQSSQVQAVADEWGPVIFDKTELNILTVIPMVFRSSDPNVLKEYSPLTYISKTNPPFLIVQGAKDTTVPPYQSQDFDAALKKGGVPVQLIMVQNAGHYLVHVTAGTPPDSPSPQQVQDDLVSFFVTNLRD